MSTDDARWRRKQKLEPRSLLLTGRGCFTHTPEFYLYFHIAVTFREKDVTVWKYYKTDSLTETKCVCNLPLFGLVSPVSTLPK